MGSGFLANIIIFSAAVASFGLSILIAAASQRREVHFWVALLAAMCGFWCLGVGTFLLMSDTVYLAMLIAKGYYAAAATIAYILVVFAEIFPYPRQFSKFNRTLLTLPYIGIMLIVFLPDGLIQQVILQPDNNVVILDPVLNLLYSTYYMIYIAIASIFYVSSYRQAKRKRSHQIVLQLRALIFGIAVTLLFGLIFNLFLPLFGNYRYIWAGPPFTLIFVGAMFYAIIKQGLFDLRASVARATAYILLLTTIGFVYISTIYTLSSIFFPSATLNSSTLIIYAALTLLVAASYQPLKRFFDNLTSKLFYQNNYYSTDEFYARISRELSVATDLRVLLQKASHEIADTLNAEQVMMYVEFSEGSHYVTAGTPEHAPLQKADIDIINLHGRESDGASVMTSRLPEDSQVRNILEGLGTDLVIPLQWHDETKSCLLIGHRRSRGYGQRDIQVLETVADELAIAIQNALSLHDIRELNATLQQRVDEATKELRASNAQLQRLDEAKDEFVSMASHQLRTPLTSVKGYISMVLEGDVGPVSDMQQKMLEEAFTSSERMVHLINDFLNVSRIQTGKFIIDKKSVDLVRMVEQEIESLKTTVEAHSMRLSYKKPKHALVMCLDEGKIRQVVMNFIDNAIFYSREHGLIEVELMVEDGDVMLKVKDSGIGVPEAEKAQLFSKFFRAANARKQRPDGTGVGLFLAKKVIDAHGGRIIFDSVEGEGSTFGFRLPMATLAANDKTNKLNE